MSFPQPKCFRTFAVWKHFHTLIFHYITRLILLKNDLKHLLVKKKSVIFGALKTIKSFAYEEAIFHHLPHGFLVCDNCKRQEAETKSRMAYGCADSQ